MIQGGEKTPCSQENVLLLRWKAKEQSLCHSARWNVIWTVPGREAKVSALQCLRSQLCSNVIPFFFLPGPNKVSHKVVSKLVNGPWSFYFSGWMLSGIKRGRIKRKLLSDMMEKYPRLQMKRRRCYADLIRLSQPSKISVCPKGCWDTEVMAALPSEKKRPVPIWISLKL